VPSAEDLAKYTANRGTIENVCVRGLHVMTTPRVGSILSGYGTKHAIRNVSISGLVMEGRPVTSAEQAKIKLKNVENLTFELAP
jgi:hypothetical protein